MLAGNIGLKTKTGSARPSATHAKRKSKPRRRPAWDSTVSDLSSLKLTPEEVDRRKTTHRSQNLDVVKEERLRKHVSKIREQQQKISTSNSGQVALLREILSGNNHFYEALENTDRLLSSVRDLLGDDPKKYPGLPYVTCAPHHSASDRSLPEEPDITSKLDLNSESVMDKSALNEFSADQASLASTSGDDEHLETVNYQPAMDLARFHQLIQEAEKEQFLPMFSEQQLKETIKAKALATNQRRGDRHAEMGAGDGNVVTQMGMLDGVRKHCGQGGGDGKTRQQVLTEETPVSSPRRPDAINDTQKVHRTRSVIRGSSTDLATSGSDNHIITGPQPTMSDFTQMLNVVQTNLADYERLTGRSESSAMSSSPNSYSGYTIALLDAVAKMSLYVKESAARWSTENAIKDQLMSDVQRLNILVDALTTDLLAAQEEYARLRNEFVKHKRDTEHQLLLFTQALGRYGIQIVPVMQSTLPMSEGIQHTGQSLPHETDVTQVTYTNNDRKPILSNASSSQPRVQSAAVLTHSVQTNGSAVSGQKTSGHLPCSSNGPVKDTWLNREPENSVDEVPQISCVQTASDSINGSETRMAGLSQPTVDIPAHIAEQLPQELQQENLDARREAIRQQIAELNRQRMLAEAKVADLRQQEHSAQQVSEKVSPSISPITVDSEQCSSAFVPHVRPSSITPEVSTLQSTADRHNKQIHIMLPHMGNNCDDKLEEQYQALPTAGRRLVSQPTNRSVSAKTQMQAGGGWFALTSHVTS